MKKAISVFLQFLLFLLVFAAGSFLPPFHIERVLSVSPAGTHLFVGDGLVLMTVLFVIILVVEALTKRLRTAAPLTTAAVILAAIVGFAIKLGFVTR